MHEILFKSKEISDVRPAIKHLQRKRSKFTRQILFTGIVSAVPLLPSQSILGSIPQFFDNVSHQLLHNLRKRKIDDNTVSWISSFLKNRATCIKLGAETTRRHNIQTSIPKGSPLSPILYLFYNAGLLDIADTSPSSTPTGGWIDDVNFMAQGDSTEETCRYLSEMNQKAEEWAAKHGSKFDSKKYK
jgi:hypothetical protein